MSPPFLARLPVRNSLILNSSITESLSLNTLSLATVKSEPLSCSVKETRRKWIYLKLALENTRKLKVTVNMSEVLRFLLPCDLRFLRTMGFILWS